MLYNKLSPAAKLICWLLTVPILGIALYLYWTGNDIMFWVNDLRETIFGNELSERRSERYGFVIVLFAVGIPTAILPFLYDFISKKGVFAK